MRGTAGPHAMPCRSMLLFVRARDGTAVEKVFLYTSIDALACSLLRSSSMCLHRTLSEILLFFSSGKGTRTSCELIDFLCSWVIPGTWWEDSPPHIIVKQKRKFFIYIYACKIIVGHVRARIFHSAQHHTDDRGTNHFLFAHACC